MKIPETDIEQKLNRDKWEAIIHSPDWVVFRKFIAEHVEYLEKESKRHLRAHEDRLAGECLFAADDCKKMLESVRVTLANLNERIEKGGK